MKERGLIIKKTSKKMKTYTFEEYIIEGYYNQLAPFNYFIDIGYFTFSGKRSGFELIKMQRAQNVSPLV